MSEEKFISCTDSLFDEFERYEHFVGIVSAWEEFFTDMYDPEFEDFYFDRFPPDVTSHNEIRIGPSFTVYFSENYGIVFNLFDSLPRESETLGDFLETAESELLPYEMRTGSGRSAPDTIDFVYMIDDKNSQTAQHRVNEIESSSEHSIKSNPILMSYDYVDAGTNPHYLFSRLAMVDNNFRDGLFPEEKELSTKLSIEDGGFETIDTPPGFFEDMKSTGVLCNEPLSELYFACYLWHSVFYEYLGDAQRIVWQGKDPSKTLPIEVTVDDLYEDLSEKYLPTNGIRKEWVSQTLSFFSLVDVAEEISKDKYKINYRNLQDHRRDHKQVVTRRSDLADLAHLLASWHCEEVLDMDITDRSKLKMNSVNVDIGDDTTQGELGEW